MSKTFATTASLLGRVKRTRNDSQNQKVKFAVASMRMLARRALQAARRHDGAAAPATGVLRAQSSLMFAALITGAQRATSALMTARNCAGELPTGSMNWAASLSRIAGA